MTKKVSVGVVFGGRSGEHEVSLVSATSIIKALDQKKYEVLAIGITKEGTWLSGSDVTGSFKSKSFSGLKPVCLSLDEKKRGVFVGSNFHALDIMFPVLHGPYGEDGTIQGLFEMARLPYVGCGVFASALAMDKYASKMLFHAFGLPQVDFVRISRDEISKNRAAVEKHVAQKLGFPCFVKPARLGSSVGVSKVKNKAGLMKAIKEAAQYDDSIIIEQGVDAREIECSVLGNEDPKVSVAGEIVPSREFYDYYAKYVDNSSELFIPAKLSKAKMKEVQQLALKAYRTIQASGLARVDFLMDKKSGKFYLNELNTLPGFTSISMYPKLWEASGLAYSKLLDSLITLGLRRHQSVQKNKISFESGSTWYKG